MKATIDLAAIDAALDSHPCLVKARLGWFDDDMNKYVSAQSIAAHWGRLDARTVQGKVADALYSMGPWWF